eukprot:13788563-Alexandrium_andersonii.AAC.1
MGLSLLASTYGHAVGRPMDYEVTGWDGNTNTGAKLLRSDLAAEDPVLLTTSFPCSPWCGASRINLAIGGQNADT